MSKGARAVRFGRWFVGVLALSLALAGCNRDGRDSGRPALNIRSSGLPPDEFLVQPREPLQQPPAVAALPVPTPGSANRTDPDTRTPLLVALGARATPGGIPASEAALVQAVGGAAPNIRGTLASEDVAFRDDNARRLERASARLQGGTIYVGSLLDPYEEAERMRAMGVTVPVVPTR